MARYTLWQTGPDDRSTYPECWGATATSPGRKVAEASTLVGLMGAVNQLHHDNWWIQAPGNRWVAGCRLEYYALPSVAKELARLAALE